MKHIMISIKPEWVAKILNGEKTIEIRKTMPNCKEPCKVYIYETKGKGKFVNCGKKRENIGGKVVAEFTLNEIENVDVPYPAYFPFVEQPLKNIAEHSCLTLYDLHKYLGTDRGYAWHIDDLKIYDKPKELSEFGLKRPPQSWCYVEGESK